MSGFFSIIFAHRDLRSQTQSYSLEPLAAFARDVAAKAGDCEFFLAVADGAGEIKVDPKDSFPVVEAVDGPAGGGLASAVNRCLDMSVGKIVGVILEPRQVSSPGLIERVREALSVNPRTVVAVRQHPGSEESGTIDWQSPIVRPAALFMARAVWRDLRGLDVRLASEDGEAAMTDAWHRVMASKDALPVVLLGEWIMPLEVSLADRHGTGSDSQSPSRTGNPPVHTNQAVFTWGRLSGET